MKIMYSLYLPQHISADLHGHRQVGVQIYTKSILGRGLHFTDKYDVFKFHTVDNVHLRHIKLGYRPTDAH